MSLMQQIGRVSANLETATRSNEFVSLAKNMMLAKRGTDAVIAAQRNGASEKVINILKSGVQAGGVSDSRWGSELAAYQTISSSFLTTLAPYSAFDAMLTGNAFIRLPLRTRIFAVTSTATGSNVDEGERKPITSLQLADGVLTQRKASCTVVLSGELVRHSSNSAIDLISRELASGVARATDSVFLNILESVSGVESNASTGLTAAQFTADLDKALHAVNLGANSKPYLILPASVVKHLAIVRDTSGALAFPQLQVNGGSIQGIRVVISDSASTVAVLLDGSQIAAASESPIQLETAEHASVQLSDNPTAGDPEFTSLWQQDLKAIRAERYFAAEVLRSDSLALITAMSTS
jgi:HK97 family phage major capsid protein